MSTQANGGGWVAWRGDLPGAVSAAFVRHGGFEWTGPLGHNHWCVRQDPRGGAFSLGAPPFARRAPVQAWRFEGPRRRTASIRAVAFLGEPAAPWPPMGPGWFETAPDPETAGALLPGLLGALPLAHYTDQLTPTGLYRFFAFETGAGQKAIGALRFWGTAAGTLGDASGDLSTFDSQVSAADSATAAGQFGQAVGMYQAAGQLGATGIGPELDTQTGGASQPLTQQAWGINTTLATIPNDLTTAGAADAQNAQGLVRQMRALYAQAQALPTAGGGAPATPPPSSGSGSVAAASAAGDALGAYLAAHGCTQAPFAAARAFQVAYNASRLGPAISVDGKYGGDAQAAWQLVLDFQGQGGQATANCFTGTAAPVPGLNPVTPPGGTTKPASSTQAGMGTGGVVALVVGSAVVVGTLAWAAATGNLPSFTTSPT